MTCVQLKCLCLQPGNQPSLHDFRQPSPRLPSHRHPSPRLPSHRHPFHYSCLPLAATIHVLRSLHFSFPSLLLISTNISLWCDTLINLFTDFTLPYLRTFQKLFSDFQTRACWESLIITPTPNVQIILPFKSPDLCFQKSVSPASTSHKSVITLCIKFLKLGVCYPIAYCVA